MSSKQSPQFNLPKAGTEYEIPVAGSLGLLALGARGIQLWRKAKLEAAARLKNQQTASGDEKK